VHIIKLLVTWFSSVSSSSCSLHMFSTQCLMLRFEFVFELRYCLLVWSFDQGPPCVQFHFCVHESKPQTAIWWSWIQSQLVTFRSVSTVSTPPEPTPRPHRTKVSVSHGDECSCPIRQPSLNSSESVHEFRFGYKQLPAHGPEGRKCANKV
jgi:hypothetical protein